ncbi:unnamed protein product [Cercopithifilaria johnstoni]|uniref:Uncharacterized protein n=1 Tax=Cercopithifilaria johnstoni TaxID=2874296 RepID=A0A8J2M0W5_9BILA|nr:unnamed protein product [Cercopithifilaria johnstoni]
MQQDGGGSPQFKCLRASANKQLPTRTGSDVHKPQAGTISRYMYIEDNQLVQFLWKFLIICRTLLSRTVH